jgi:hypothetical protein
MTILGLPFYLYIVIAAMAWLFHVAEMHLMYRPISVMQRGWSKQQKKAFDKAVYERDRVLAFYMNTGFCQWCEEREARRHHLAKAALLIHDWRLSLALRSPSAAPLSASTLTAQGRLCTHCHRWHTDAKCAAPVFWLRRPGPVVGLPTSPRGRLIVVPCGSV